VELVGWWWNGHWGRLARRDVRIYADGEGGFILERWDGGQGQRWLDLSEPTAKFAADDLMSDSEGWRCMTQ
jgi:hypothetical protein